MKKKIKVVTLWDSYNYGAFLQAYAFTYYLKKENFEVFVLEECRENRRSIFGYIYDLLIFFTFNKEKKYYSKLCKGYRKCQQIFSICKSSLYSNASIIGADEVWNTDSIHFKHIPQYVGRELNSDIKFSYAPSCNATSYDSFIKYYGADPFGNLSSISVRDIATMKFVSHFPNNGITQVLDPTFLCDNYKNMEIPTSNKDYILVYGYTFENKEIEEIRSFAKLKGKILISVGMFLSWTDIQIPANPWEFLGLIDGASYVVTSTFHGTVFSIIYKKEFCSYARNNRKVLDLLKEFKLESRNASSHVINSVFSDNIEYSKVMELLELKKNSSIFYLSNALKDI